jgi:hypothetical protein
MSTPIKIVVAGDFGAEKGDAALYAIRPGRLCELWGELCPCIEVAGVGQVRLSGLDDFLPTKLAEQLGLDVPEDAATLTRVLHDGHFQAVEASWRGLALLAQRLPAEGVCLEVLHTPFADLRRRVLDCIIRPEHAGHFEIPTTAVLLDFDFLPHGETFDVLVDLARMGESIKVPMVAGTNAGFFGIKHLLHLCAIDSIAETYQRPLLADYQSFRNTDASFWVGLTLNRFLLREPHAGAQYNEPHSPSEPNSYLWGRGIWLLGVNIMESFVDKGHLLGISGIGTGGEIRGLPTRRLPLSRSSSVETPLEAVLPLEFTEALPYLGLSPIAQLPEDLGGHAQPGMVYVHLAANLHRIPDPEEQRLGLLTVHTSLAYSLTMGRVANLAWRHLGAIGAIPPDQAGPRLAQRLQEELWHKDEQEIEVVLTSSGSLSIKYAPHLVIHTRRFEVDLEIGL